METMANNGIMCRGTMGQDMPFGPKRTAGISGHYSVAWAIAPQLGAEACRSQWKPGKSLGSGWKTGKGSEGVWEGQERCGRGPEGRGKMRRRREGTGKLRYVTPFHIFTSDHPPPLTPIPHKNSEAQCQRLPSFLLTLKNMTPKL